MITRSTSGVGAVVGQIGESNALGRGQWTSKKDLIEMKYVSGSVDVKVGQSVFTTGQDDIYPAGLKIGEIVNVVSGSATTPHMIEIKPAAKMDSMQEVGILLYKPAEKPAYEQKLPNAVKAK